MDRLLLLQKPSEQSRLLSEIPEVIADVELEPDRDDSTKEDEKVNNGELPELLPRRRTRNLPYNLMSNGISQLLNDSTNAAGLSFRSSIIMSDMCQSKFFWNLNKFQNFLLFMKLHNFAFHISFDNSIIDCLL